MLFLLTLLAMTAPENIETKFEVHDGPAFHALVAEDAQLVKLADGFRFLEGPAWVGDGLIFTDIPNQTLHKYTPGEGVAVWRKRMGNGNTLGPDGELYMAGHDSRTVGVADLAAGTERVLVEDFGEDGRGGEGTKFNSPNDIVVRSDGLVFFTDPYWGLPGDKREELMEYGGCWVFIHDPKTGEARPIARDFNRPNGLAFSPDEQHLFIGDDEKKHIRRFDVAEDGSLRGGDVFCTIEPGVPDGMRVDAHGNLWTTAGDGVQVFDPEGRLLGKVLCPETPANCELAEGKLFMTAQTGLYAIDVNVGGATGRGAMSAGQ